MKRTVIICLFVAIAVIALLAACSGPQITPAPTATAAPAATATTLSTRTPQPNVTRSPITVKDVQANLQADGSVKTTASVSTGDLGLGQVEIASPDSMFINESRAIRMLISPAKQLAAATPVAVTVKSPDLPGFVYKFSGNVQLYPVMYAELRALTFTVGPTGQVRRAIEGGNNTLTWDWLISPRSAGRQDLSIELAIPAVVNGASTELTTNVLQNIPMTISVLNIIPTPVPASNRIGDSIVNNAGAIVVALIGLAGTIIGILYKTRSDREKADPNSGKKPKK